MGAVQRGLIQRGDQANWDGKTATASRVDATGGTITGLAIGNAVDVLQVYGAAANRTRGSIAAAVQKIGSTVVTLVFAPGTWTIDDDLTIPSNFTCHIPAGCLLEVATGKTLTINGHVQAGLYQVFSGAGTAISHAVEIYPEWWGALTSAANNSSAINSAIVAANNANGGKVLVSPGTCKCTDDVVMYPNVILEGVGRNSHLQFNGCKLSLDNIAATDHLDNWTIRDIQVSRIGAAGTAVLMEGDLTDGDVIRFTVERLNISSSTGDGLTMRGTYIGDFWSPLIRGCTGTGVVMELDTTTSGTATNAISFFGGEIQNNNVGMTCNNVSGLNLYGTTIEGNDTIGVDLLRRCISVHFWSCWLEGNGTTTSHFDIRIGNNASAPRACENIGIHGGIFSDGTSGKDHAIEVINVLGFSARDVFANGYGTSFVKNSQLSNGAVRGWVRDFHSTDEPAIDSPNEFFQRDDYTDDLSPRDTLTSAGALSIETRTTFFDSTAGVMAVTLADGIEDQKKRLLHHVDGGDVTLTFGGDFYPPGGSIVFKGGDTADLWFRNGRWAWMGGSATLVTSGSGAYTPTNVSADRAFDADTVAVAELADIVGTMIADLQAKGHLS